MSSSGTANDPYSDISTVEVTGGDATSIEIDSNAEVKEYGKPLPKRRKKRGQKGGWRRKTPIRARESQRL